MIFTVLIETSSNAASIASGRYQRNALADGLVLFLTNVDRGNNVKNNQHPRPFKCLNDLFPSLK